MLQPSSGAGQFPRQGSPVGGTGGQQSLQPSSSGAWQLHGQGCWSAVTGAGTRTPISVSKQVDTGVKTAGSTKGQIVINQTAIQIVDCGQGPATSQNLHCYVPYAYESTPCISAGFPKTAQSFSCSATPNACNFSGCHHDSSQCMVPMAGLKTSCCRKRTPERVKFLKLDKERLQARVAELEARLASHAVTKIDSDKITLL